MLKYELLHRGARFQKALDEDRSLRLLSKEKEVELAHWSYEAYQSLNNESYLMEHVTLCPGRVHFTPFNL